MVIFLRRKRQLRLGCCCGRSRSARSRSAGGCGRYGGGGGIDRGSARNVVRAELEFDPFGSGASSARGERCSRPGAVRNHAVRMIRIDIDRQGILWLNGIRQCRRRRRGRRGGGGSGALPRRLCELFFGYKGRGKALPAPGRPNDLVRSRESIFAIFDLLVLFRAAVD